MAYFHILKGVERMSFHPTLWRTCRVLANPRRLACLKAVLTNPGETVGATASAVGLPQDQASLCLRSLQARGLLHAIRKSRWVRYYPQPDPLVPIAAPILDGVRQSLLKKGKPEARMLRCLTAFTHPRRLVILRLLQQNGPTPFPALAHSSRISQAALFRHLHKLLERGLVFENDAGWAINPDHDPFADAFLILLAFDTEQSTR